MFEKRRIVVALAAIMVAIFATSCAEQKLDHSDVFAYESFEAWVKKYDPRAEKMASGVYINFIDRDSDWSTLPAPVLNVSWLSLNYTGRTFGRDVFETRDSSLTRMLGTWAATTHFTDDFVSYNVSQQLCAGLVDALSYMRVGDSVRVYIPSSLGYASTMNVNTGYVNSGIVYVNFPVYFDIRLNEIVDDAYQSELTALRLKAIKKGFDPVKDSIDNGLYMRIITPNPVGDTITADSTVAIWYGAYFFDGKLALTNNDTLAKEAGYYLSTEKYEAQPLTPTSFNSTTGTYLVYPKVVLKMRTGERAEVLSASWWGAGMSGNLAAKPQLLPYQSLTYYIDVIAKTSDEDEEESE